MSNLSEAAKKALDRAAKKAQAESTAPDAASTIHVTVNTNAILNAKDLNKIFGYERNKYSISRMKELGIPYVMVGNKGFFTTFNALDEYITRLLDDDEKRAAAQNPTEAIQVPNKVV